MANSMCTVNSAFPNTFDYGDSIHLLPLWSKGVCYKLCNRNFLAVNSCFSIFVGFYCPSHSHNKVRCIQSAQCVYKWFDNQGICAARRESVGMCISAVNYPSERYQVTTGRVYTTGHHFSDGTAFCRGVLIYLYLRLGDAGWFGTVIQF